MRRKRALVLALAAGAFLAVGAVAVPASATDAPRAAAVSGISVVKGDVTPFIGLSGVPLYEYANQTTIWVYRGRVVLVSTAALHCNQPPTACQPASVPSMWNDAVKALDPLAPLATRQPGGIDALNYNDQGGAGEAKPAVLDMYRRSLRSALAKAGL